LILDSIRHPHAAKSARQAHRAAGISDHGGGLDARHDIRRIASPIICLAQGLNNLSRYGDRVASYVNN
jgi:hypothetical protein